MDKPGPDDPPLVQGVYLFYRVCRGVSVTVLALGLYVGLTNWSGDGSVWAFRYTGIAVAVFALGRIAYYLLAERR